MRGRGLGRGHSTLPRKNIFLYTGSVVRVSASSSFIAVSHLNAHPQSLGPTSMLFFSVDMFFLVSYNSHSNYQIGPNLTKSEIPSTKSGTFFGLAFFPMLIYRELNFDTDCFNAYVTSCSYTN